MQQTPRARNLLLESRATLAIADIQKLYRNWMLQTWNQSDNHGSDHNWVLGLNASIIQIKQDSWHHDFINTPLSDLRHPFHPSLDYFTTSHVQMLFHAMLWNYNNKTRKCLNWFAQSNYGYHQSNCARFSSVQIDQKRIVISYISSVYLSFQNLCRKSLFFL